MTAVIYRCLSEINIYDSQKCDRLATQLAIGRFLSFLANPESSSVLVRSHEDNYSGFLAIADLTKLEPHDPSAYIPAQCFSESEIQIRIPGAIAYAQAAMAAKNEYLWGGTVPPNFDCSGLMQAAFASIGIWIPRDAYQQQDFAMSIPERENFEDWLTQLVPGDLIFFGTPIKATHVGIYLGNGTYLHSSGKEQGHNGIAIDSMAFPQNEVAQKYRNQLRGAGRIVV
jgi:hypothetical protein